MKKELNIVCVLSCVEASLLDNIIIEEMRLPSYLMRHALARPAVHCLLMAIRTMTQKTENDMMVPLFLADNGYNELSQNLLLQQP